MEKSQTTLQAVIELKVDDQLLTKKNMWVGGFDQKNKGI